MLAPAIKLSFEPLSGVVVDAKRCRAPVTGHFDRAWFGAVGGATVPSGDVGACPHTELVAIPESITSPTRKEFANRFSADRFACLFLAFNRCQDCLKEAGVFLIAWFPKDGAKSRHRTQGVLESESECSIV